MSELRNFEDYYTKEIIDGEIYYMSPGISAHLIVITRISNKFDYYFMTNNKKCSAYTEGLEVYLDGKKNKNLVVPDIAIICDYSKFRRRGYYGVPELVVEVLSKSTSKKDRSKKFKAYQKAGVKEYWIVDIKNTSIDQYVLENDEYDLKNTVALMDEVEFEKLTEDQKKEYTTIISPTMFDEIKIDLNEIFEKLDFVD